ncbi:sporulation protein YqfC/sporulation protein YabP,TIGR02892 [Melghirimyces profundicolus]|uniref:Sporulation protein YqfC/sporulation protein YabP,TIGR02892 n=1 Tax=Melghirimyces profundicolus TaxID=1242148 RepID=A0A2T6BGQ8_9BACL|nr:sporulation protein YabP [Melghirimyces profundicolus]PTX55248.1 sporulation protein YqfC/sporulation protein YabP,TIGR02892 [Melghirimyces profundicolus]
MAEELYLSGTVKHEVTMVGRNTLDITGVLGVESFDSEEFLLQTECGYLGVRGTNLHIQTLDLEQGRVAIEGEFYEMSYLDDGPSRAGKTKGLIGRLFR